MSCSWTAALVGCAIIAGACGDPAGHSCGSVFYNCTQQTVVTLQAPGDVWAAGVYTLAVQVDGSPGHCTIEVTDPSPTNGVSGNCGSGGDLTLAFAPLESCPVVCNGTACGGMGCTPIPDHFQMTVTIPGLPAQISLSFLLNGQDLVNETIMPKSNTIEPNGAGCGSCTTGSAAILVASG